MDVWSYPVPVKGQSGSFGQESGVPQKPERRSGLFARKSSKKNVRFCLTVMFCLFELHSLLFEP